MSHGVEIHECILLVGSCKLQPAGVVSSTGHSSGLTTFSVVGLPRDLKSPSEKFTVSQRRSESERYITSAFFLISS